MGTVFHDKTRYSHCTAKMQGKFFAYLFLVDRPATISFVLTFSKLFIALVAFVLITGHNFFSLLFLHIAAVILVTTAVVTDILDGIIFKYSEYAQDTKIRNLRRVLDVVCDRFLIYFTLIPLAFIGFPLIPFSLIMLREVIATIVCGLPYIRKGFVGKPMLVSRIATLLIAVQVIYYCLGYTHSLLLSTAFIIFSAIGIIQRLIAPKPN